ncbi:uncharacterized protein [Rutidosis leptorrhynchoides]|uniref:uncharacterized protein n=1 Tax=Rutidosis leptorrhynchoides TaxID=125765 RepID=UPI003A998E7C
MDPYLEQKLRDEVLYLHSLWHHSPVSTSQQPTINLQPFNSTHFKKPRKKKPKKKHPKKVGNFSGKEWPVKPPSADPPLTQSGWPELKLKPNPQPSRVLTAQELEKYNWKQVQIKALNAAKDFFSANCEESDDDDDDAMDDNENGDTKFEFFWNLFNGDEDFKGYYVKHCGGGGEFTCLVCGGAEKKQKMFKDCIALVQHCVSIMKTKKKWSHRAYGTVICKVLEWDIDRLPSSIVAEHKATDLQGSDVNGDKDVDIEACNEAINKNLDNEDLNGKVNDATETVDGDSMVCEEVVSVVANVEEESSGNQVLNEAEGNTRGAVINLCRNLSSTMVLEAAAAFRKLDDVEEPM